MRVDKVCRLDKCSFKPHRKKKVVKIVEDFVNSIAAIFFYGIWATPFISFFIVRELPISRIGKVMVFFLITLVLAFLFFSIATDIYFRNGLA